MNSGKVIGKIMAALLLERIMANFIGTSVWLFKKKKIGMRLTLFFSQWLLKYYLIKNKYFGF